MLLRLESVARKLNDLTAGGRMDYTAVSVAIKRFEQRLSREPELRRQAERLLVEN